jgi:hypothetical protein
LCCFTPATVALGSALRQADAPAQPAAPAEASTLFATDAPLVLRIATDLRALLRDRGDERQEHDAVLRYATPSGDTGSLKIEVRTRGIFRLKRCAFPPLRLDFPRSRVAGTPFAAQDKIKLVTHCREQESYEQNLLLEYALYRAYHALTERSFRARLAHVTYVDTERRDSITRYAFLIESDAELARRLGGEPLEADNVHDVLIDDETMALVAVFQYQIGNTDWSVWQRHNIAIIRQAQGPLLAIPYDFDFAGVIGAPYATPSPQLPIRSVRERLYRGFCQPETVVMPVVARFHATKDSVHARLRAVPGLDPRELKSALDYLDGFYRIVADPKAAHRELVQRCRQVPS